MIKLLFDSHYAQSNFSLRAVISVVNNMLLRLKPPKFIHRLPRKIEDYTHWKASELLAFFFYYSVVIFKAVMRPVFYNHYLKLVTALSYLSATSISEEMIDRANVLLHEFVRDFENLYGLRFCSINIHMLLHLSDCVRELGPLWTYSCFPYENMNGQILRDIHGKTNVDSQITRMHWQTLKLPSRLNNLREGPVKNYCLRKHRQLKITERIQQSCYVVGCYSERDVNDPLIAQGFRNINFHFRHVKAYTRLLKKELLYVSDKYSRVLRSNSSCAVFQRGASKSYGCIYIFVKALQCDCEFGCNCDGEHFAIIRSTEKIGGIGLLDHHNTFLHYMHEGRMTLNVTAVRVQDLISVCFYMNVNNNLFIAERVNHSKNE